MSRSVLLQLARDSIAEVYEAQRTIDKQALLQEHPLLNQNIKTTLNLYIDQELKGTYTTAESSLLANIILSAKKATFEDKQRKTLTTSEYLNSELELILYTPEGVISERDPALVQTHLETTQSP